MISIC